ncbi:MAG TPA: S8 family serine peptidase [Candidatus Paceibacterota bacterium]
MKATILLIASLQLGVVIGLGTGKRLVDDQGDVELFLAKPKVGQSVARVSKAHVSNGVRVARTLKNVGGIQILEIPRASADSIVASYRTNGMFEFIKPNIVGEPRDFSPPNDPLYACTNQIRWVNNFTFTRNTYGAMTHNNMGRPINLVSNGIPIGSMVPARKDASIHLLEGWEIQASAPHVVVAVIDSGFAGGHPDAQGILWTNTAEIAWDEIDNDANGITNDINGIGIYKGTNGSLIVTNLTADWGTHGTMVGGGVGAIPDNGIGTAGIVRDAHIMVVRTFFDEVGIVTGFDYALAKGAKIINCSWGFVGTEPLALKEAFAAANAAGVLCVAATVNSFVDYDTLYPDYPARWKKTAFNPDGFGNICVVASSMPDDRLAPGASPIGRNTVDIMAPGFYVLSLYADGGYAFGNGTSYAASHVSGVAALVMEHYPGLVPEQVIHLLNATVDPGWDIGTNTISGGRLNLYRSLASLKAEIHIRELDKEQGTVSLELTNTLPNLTYTVERSIDMTEWVYIGYVRGTNSVLSLTDTNAIADKVMYRYLF